MQIPVEALPDTMTVREPVDSKYGGEYGEPVTVSNVRFDSSESLRSSHIVLSEGSTGLVFVDAENSVGGYKVPAGSIIEIGGEDMNVVKTTEYRGFSEIHHWEIEVR